MPASPASTTPEIVGHAVALATARGFALSSEPTVGRLLAVLAAAVPVEGRILELGTGAGVGAAWIVSGLGARKDVEFVTVEVDPELAHDVAGLPWDRAARFMVGDGAALLPTLGTFDLIFADAEGGKWHGLDLTIDALRPGGVLFVDDMDVTRYDNPEHVAKTSAVRDRLLTDPRLIAVELHTVSGLVLATRLH
jgi:predicted O-methyltransferase YrrM